MIKLKEILEMFNLWLFPTRACCPSCKDYYRQVLTFVPGGVAVVAFIALLSLLPYKIGLRPNTGINLSWQKNLVWTNMACILITYTYTSYKYIGCIDNVSLISQNSRLNKTSFISLYMFDWFIFSMHETSF